MSRSILLLSIFFGYFGQVSLASEYKVLVVMSYEENNPWCEEIREGIETALGDTSEITYAYMDTKVNAAGGPGKAQDALNTYRALQPDGVIAVDDNAQSMFVVPFLKDQVDTPVMFAGVNAKAAKYGYPNSHISGVLERAHVHESLAFAKQLLPNISSACFLTKNVSSGLSLKKQVAVENSRYPIKVNNFYLVKSLQELENLSSELQSTCDTVLVDSLEGILSQDKTPMNNKAVLSHLSKLYSGPLLGGNRYQVKQGAWAAVVKTGQEQGEKSAAMLLKAMRGTPVKQIPITTNSEGERIVNVSALDRNNVHLKPLVLRGVTLVRQTP